MSSPILIFPGFGNSGPLHWQSLWEQANPDFSRVQQRDWDNPVCADWVAALEAAVMQAGPHVVLVAHSLASIAGDGILISANTLLGAGYMPAGGFV